MRIDEVNITGEDNELPFSVAEDLVVFMRNDPMFYRKNYFPCMSSMSDRKFKGEEIDFAECTRPMIERAINEYCRKFDITQSPQSIFTSEDEDAIIELLKAEEMPRIEMGEY
jgi:hypothetical protein